MSIRTLILATVLVIALLLVPESSRAASFQRVYTSAYGPGLFGNRTACGQTLTTRTVGVAHRSLPCGSRVQVCRVGVRCITVRVIDRGPFVSGRTFDLTQRTVQLLGVRDCRAWGHRRIAWRRP